MEDYTHTSLQPLFSALLTKDKLRRMVGKLKEGRRKKKKKEEEEFCYQVCAVEETIMIKQLLFLLSKL